MEALGDGFIGGIRIVVPEGTCLFFLARGLFDESGGVCDGFLLNGVRAVVATDDDSGGGNHSKGMVFERFAGVVVASSGYELTTAKGGVALNAPRATFSDLGPVSRRVGGRRESLGLYEGLSSGSGVVACESKRSPSSSSEVVASAVQAGILESAEDWLSGFTAIW